DIFPDRILIESSSSAVLHPLVELVTVANEIGEVRSVPGRNISLERLGIRPREAAAHAMASGAYQIRGAFTPRERQRVFRRLLPRGGHHERHEIVDLPRAEPLPERRHAQ